MLASLAFRDRPPAFLRAESADHSAAFCRNDLLDIGVMPWKIHSWPATDIQSGLRMNRHWPAVLPAPEIPGNCRNDLRKVG